MQYIMRIKTVIDSAFMSAAVSTALTLGIALRALLLYIVSYMYYNH